MTLNELFGTNEGVMKQRMSNQKPNHAEGIISQSKSLFMTLIISVFALSMSACNGKVFSSFFGNGASKFLPILLLPKIQSIEVTPNTKSVPSGVPADFNVIVTFEDGSSRALTPQEMAAVTWTSDHPAGLHSITFEKTTPENYGHITAVKTDYLGGRRGCDHYR